MTTADGNDDQAASLGDDRELVHRLTLLGKALGNPVRVRIAAALLRVDEASPKDLNGVLGDNLGNISYHVRYLHTLGFLRLKRLVPRRGAVAHKYGMEASLRRALPAAAHALGEGKDRPDALPDGKQVTLSYYLVDLQASEVITAHGDALTRVLQALSDDIRTQILAYLLQHDHATTTTIAMGMDLSRPTVTRHLDILAKEHMVQHTAEPTQEERWTVTPPTRTALAGFKDLLHAFDEPSESPA